VPPNIPVSYHGRLYFFTHSWGESGGPEGLGPPVRPFGRAEEERHLSCVRRDALDRTDYLSDEIYSYQLPYFAVSRRETGSIQKSTRVTALTILLTHDASIRRASYPLAWRGSTSMS
jgi:hypothetical protein